jgi:hypothetical protein
LAELLLEKPFFLESIIKCFLNIWLYKHRKNKHHIFFKSRVSLLELNTLLSAGFPWRLLPHGLFVRQPLLKPQLLTPSYQELPWLPSLPTNCKVSPRSSASVPGESSSVSTRSIGNPSPQCTRSRPKNHRQA